MSHIQKNISVFALAIVFSFIVFYWMFSATWVGATGGLLAGSFMAVLTLILGLIAFGIQYQRQQSALQSKQKSVADTSVHKTRSIEIDMSLDAAFAAAVEALSTLDGDDIPKTQIGIPSKQTLKIYKSDESMGRIEAGLRSKTLGITDPFDFSKITIQLQRIDAQTTGLQIESQPTSPIEGFDLGRNTHYVNHLALNIRQASHANQASDRLREERASDNLQIDDNQSIQARDNNE